MLAFVVLGEQGWSGAPNACLLAGDCYCEAPRPGLIAQPANTWSCLAGVIVGLMIAWDTGRRHRTSTGSFSSLMGSNRFYAGLYALVVTYSGVAAMFFHASLTNLGGKLDLSSMYLFIDYWILFNVARVYGLSRSTFLWLYCSITALLLIPREIGRAQV